MLDHRRDLFRVQALEHTEVGQRERAALEFAQQAGALAAVGLSLGLLGRQHLHRKFGRRSGWPLLLHGPLGRRGPGRCRATFAVLGAGRAGAARRPVGVVLGARSPLGARTTAGLLRAVMAWATGGRCALWARRPERPSRVAFAVAGSGLRRGWHGLAIGLGWPVTARAARALPFRTGCAAGLTGLRAWSLGGRRGPVAPWWLTTFALQQAPAVQFLLSQLAVLFAELTRRLAIQVKALRGFRQRNQVAGGTRVAVKERTHGALAELPRCAGLDVGLDAQLQGLGLADKQRGELLLEQFRASRWGLFRGGRGRGGRCFSRHRGVRGWRSCGLYRRWLGFAIAIARRRLRRGCVDGLAGRLSGNGGHCAGASGRVNWRRSARLDCGRSLAGLGCGLRRRSLGFGRGQHGAGSTVNGGFAS